MKTKVLVLGGSGLVGSRFVDVLSDRFQISAPTHKMLDVTDERQISDALDQIRPDQILYAAGYTNVDLAEEEREKCYLLNVEAVKFFTESANNLNIPFYYLSTDYVFDGTQKDTPYNEEDRPNPLPSVYAKSKRDGEVVALESNNKNCVIRLIMPFSGVYKKKLDLVRLVLTRLQKGEEVLGIIDQKINPIIVDDLVWGIGKILERYANGIYHLGAIDYTTPARFIREIAKQFNLPQHLIKDMTFEEFSKTRVAIRPQHSWLATEKFRKEFGSGILHTIEEEIRLFKSQVDSKHEI